MENEEIKKEPVNPGEVVKPVKKRKGIGKPVQSILGGEIFSRNWFIKNIYFLIYVAFLAIIFISNTYYAEKTFKEIERTKIELKELRYQYLTTKSELMFEGKQTELIKRTARLGLKESLVPPFKIFYNNPDSIREKP